MQYIIKTTDDGSVFACRTGVPKHTGTRCISTFVRNKTIRTADGPKRVEETYNRISGFVKAHGTEIDAATICVLEILKADGRPEPESAFLRKGRNVYEIIHELPKGCDLKEGDTLSEEKLQLLLCPYPQIILQLAELLKTEGEVWKDDTSEEHVDDINPIRAAEKIYNALKTHKIDFITEQLIKHEDN